MLIGYWDPVYRNPGSVLKSLPKKEKKRKKKKGVYPFEAGFSIETMMHLNQDTWRIEQ
jgi:hypothetical protein